MVSDSCLHPEKMLNTYVTSNVYIECGGSMVKNPPANVGDTRDPGSIPGQEDPLEKETATHSSIVTWRIPWTEEPGSLQSMGSQRVGHD